MMQTIYSFGQSYPFNNQNIPNSTFVDVVIECSSQEEVQMTKQRMNAFKRVQCDHLIKLMRVYREENCLHAIYQYYEQSLEEYIKCCKVETKSDNLKNIANIKLCISSCIKSLVKHQIRADLYLSGMAVDKKGNAKVFVHPQFQLIKDADDLIEFYQTEEKRINVEIQEMYQQYHGKTTEKDDRGNLKSPPNFLINGNQLVFTNDIFRNVIDNLQAANQDKQPQTLSEQLMKRKSLNDNYRKLPTIFNPFDANQYVENIEMTSSAGGSIEMTSSAGGRAEQIIKKSKQLNSKVIELIGKQKNEAIDVFVQQSNEEILKQERDMAKIKIFAQSKKNSGFNMNNQSTGSGNNSKAEESEQNNKKTNSNAQSETQIIGNTKMKIRITTHHQVQVEAKELQKVKRQIVMNQNGNGLNELISKGLNVGTTFEEDPLIPSQITNQCNYHQKNYSQRNNMLADRAKLLKEKAEKLLSKKANSKQ